MQQGDEAPKPEQDLRTFNPAPHETQADREGTSNTMKRKVTEHLYLLIKQGSGAGLGGSGSAKPGWTFPVAKHEGDESIGETAQRALRTAIGNAHPVFFVGNAPMAHTNLHRHGCGPLFFLLAQVVDDPWVVSLKEGCGATEHAWVTKGELASYLGDDPRLKDLLQRML